MGTKLALYLDYLEYHFFFVTRGIRNTLAKKFRYGNLKVKFVVVRIKMRTKEKFDLKNAIICKIFKITTQNYTFLKSA